MIAYVAGIATIVCLPVLPSLYFFVLPLILLFLKPVPAFVRAGCIGMLWAMLWSHWQMAHRLDTEPLKSDWRVAGEVVDLPKRQGTQQRFVLSVDFARPLGSIVNHSWPFRYIQISWYRSDYSVRVGDRLELDVRLKPPHGYSNPGGFDYELWLLANGIDATGYVRASYEIQPRIYCHVACWRERLISYVQGRYADTGTHALVQALVLGVRDGFSEQQWEWLRATGTVHLAVISGLHIGFIALLIMMLCRPLKYIVPVSVIRTLELALVLLAAGGYVLLAGAALPTQRAFIMIAVLLFAGWRYWHVDLWDRWWFAMAAVLTLSPVAVHMTGFWLSFTAVAVLLWVARYHKIDKIGLRAQGAIFVGLLPLLAFAFGGISLIAPLINLVAIPLIGVVLVVAAMDMALGSIGSDLLVDLVDLTVSGFWHLVMFGAEIQPEIWTLPDRSLVSLVFASIGAFLLLHPSGFPAKGLGLCLWLPLFVGRSDTGEDGFQAWVADVGQGTAVMVQYAGKTLLYDTGPAFFSGHSTYRYTLAPLLNAMDVEDLDYLVVSHDDLDHTGGMREVLREHPPKVVLSGSSKLVSGHGFKQCEQGQSWQWGDLTFRMLAGGDEKKGDNNSSCVLYITDGRCSLLLTGDIDTTVERSLPAPDRPLTWLIASHHGSKTGTGQMILRNWQPEHVIFTAGYANRFRHPAEEVLARVQAYRADTWITGKHGAIHLAAPRSGECRINSWRSMRPRFWAAY